MLMNLKNKYCEAVNLFTILVDSIKNYIGYYSCSSQELDILMREKQQQRAQETTHTHMYNRLLHVATYSINLQVIFYSFTMEEHSIVLSTDIEQKKNLKPVP